MFGDYQFAIPSLSLSPPPIYFFLFFFTRTHTLRKTGVGVESTPRVIGRDTFAVIPERVTAKAGADEKRAHRANMVKSNKTLVTKVTKSYVCRP